MQELSTAKGLTGSGVGPSGLLRAEPLKKYKININSS
jgi:hypothetical protein